MGHRLHDPRLITTWSRLLAGGHSAGHIRAQLDAGRWRRWGHAIALHNGPLSREQRWFVARAHAGPRALLTGLTAAEAFGLTGWSRQVVHVLAPPGTRRVAGCPVALRITRRSPWSQVRRHNRSSGVHCAPDAFLVAAATSDSVRAACGVLAAGVQQGVVGVDALAQALDLSPRFRRHRLLVAAIHDIGQGSQALREIDFLRLCRRYRLPVPMQQKVRAEPGGRRRYLDASWRRRDGRLVVAEVDGALHLVPSRWWADQSRQNELVISDALVLRFPSVVVRCEPARVADQLRRALWL